MLVGELVEQNESQTDQSGEGVLYQGVRVARAEFCGDRERASASPRIWNTSVSTRVSKVGTSPTTGTTPTSSGRALRLRLRLVMVVDAQRGLNNHRDGGVMRSALA
jgi:hypothetical protein